MDGVVTSKLPYGTKQLSPLTRVGKLAESATRRLTVPARDWVRNRRYVRADRKIALVRHRKGLPSYYKKFLHWTAQNFPEVRSQMELRLLPCGIRNGSQYSLVVPWLPDTLLYRDGKVRQQAFALTATADARGVPVINRPEHLLSTSKHDCAQRIAELGVRTPQVKRILDIEGFRRNLNGLKPPLLVREDLAHGGWSPVFVLHTVADCATVPLEKFAQPIAVEYVDVRDPRDRLVRKYRYMAMGKTGIAHTLQISKNWEVRSGVRVLTDQTIAEEIQYADTPDPHHEVFQHLRHGLDLDFLAFDYSLDRQGELVIWEINVLPGLGLPTGPNRSHLVPPIERAMAATLQMYLERAGLELPSGLKKKLEVEPRRSVITDVAVQNSDGSRPMGEAA